MKKTMIVVSIVTIMAMLVGCAPEVTQADETPAPVSQTAQVILAEGDVATPVPEPEVVLTDLPDDVEIPDFYAEVLIPGVAERVFAFTMMRAKRSSVHMASSFRLLVLSRLIRITMLRRLKASLLQILPIPLPKSPQVSSPLRLSRRARMNPTSRFIPSR